MNKHVNMDMVDKFIRLAPAELASAKHLHGTWPRMIESMMNMIKALASEVHELDAQWRTMDAAPKDRTQVNLCVLSGGVAEVVRGRRSDTPGWWATEIGAFTDENVTHWMPLQKPPEVTK